MIVTCPNCSTKFNLPDAQCKPGANLRCSVCKNVFSCPAPAFAEPPPPESGDLDLNLDFETAKLPTNAPKAKKSRRGLGTLLLVLLLAGLGAGGWMYRSQVTAFVVPYLPASVTAFFQPAPPPVSAENLTGKIGLRGVRQYSVKQEKGGTLSVIEGKVVNGFPDPREFIRVEAALYDRDGKAVVSKEQLAGTAVSFFQLQVLSEKELEQALSNKIDVLTHNTNVPPEGEVPFMVVFYNPPEQAVEFGLQVVGARLPPEPQK